LGHAAEPVNSNDFSTTISNARSDSLRVANMMTLPFFVLTAALGAIWSGNRKLAIGLCGAALLVTLVLFRMHVTSELGLGL
jgi:hypothetical protein